MVRENSKYQLHPIWISIIISRKIYPNDKINPKSDLISLNTPTKVKPLFTDIFFIVSTKIVCRIKIRQTTFFYKFFIF